MKLADALVLEMTAGGPGSGPHCGDKSHPCAEDESSPRTARNVRDEGFVLRERQVEIHYQLAKAFGMKMPSYNFDKLKDHLKVDMSPEDNMKAYENAHNSMYFKAMAWSEDNLPPALYHAGIQLNHRGFQPSVLRTAKIDKIEVDRQMGVTDSRKPTGLYWVGKRKIQLLRTDANFTDVLLHELGHHIDYTQLHSYRSMFYEKRTWYVKHDLAEQDSKGAIEEFARARNLMEHLEPGLSSTYDHFKGDNVKLLRLMGEKNDYRIMELAPSIYALHNRQEWLAESFMKYNSMSTATHYDLKTKAPKTYKLMKKANAGAYLTSKNNEDKINEKMRAKILGTDLITK